MATSQTEPTHMDHLSSLPDALLVSILSLLPTRVAARTSVLSRRFQHLWKDSPSVDLRFYDPNTRFDSMANGVIFSRQPSNPLLRLRLFMGPAVSGVPASFISSLLTHARSHALRHLTLIDHTLIDHEDIQSIVRTVFSISSLEFLSIFSLDTFAEITLPSATPLTHLKSLSIRNRVSSAQVEQLLLELCCLDHLQLTHVVQSTAASVNLSSRTVKKLEVFSFSPFEEGTCSVGLFMPSLDSLSIFSLDIFSERILPSATPLTHLKSLSIRNRVNSAQVNRLLLELYCLNHLQICDLVQSSAAMVNLSSSTVKKLELFTISPSGEGTCSVGLFMPSLELFYLENNTTLPHIHGDIPLLRKSVITLRYLDLQHVTAVAQLLNCISHVEELSLDLKQSEEFPFFNLLKRGKEAPAFPNLKHLDAHMCFHEHNFKAVVSLLRQSPALQSLKLVHKAACKSDLWRSKDEMSYWVSKLPHNVDGNHQYVYFSNLHLKENNEEFMKLLNKSSTPKKRKTYN